MADGQVFRIEIPVEVTSKGDGGLSKIQADIQKTETALKRIASSGNSAFSQVKAGASGASSALSSAGSQADAFSQRVQKSGQSIRSAFAEKVSLVLQAVDQISPVVKEITGKVKAFAQKAWSVTVKLVDLATAPFKALKNMITSPLTMTLSIAGISLGAQSFYQTFTEFESGMSNVKALSGATDSEFEQLSKTAANLGATTKFTASQAAEGMQYLAMAGWETSQILDGMPGLLQLAAAGSTDLGTAADIISDVMTAMGMSADQASRAADVFARTATSTNTTISMMGETLKYAAPVAHSFGLSLEEVSAVTGMMANAGIKASSAGTALRSALLRMASPPTEAAKALSKLGLSFADAQGNMKDMQTILREMGDAFGGLSQQEKLAYADDIFGKNAASAWLSVIDQGAATYDKLYGSLLNASGAAQDMADIQLDNLAGDVTILQSAVDGMKISLMERLGPYLRQGVQWVTAQIPNLTQAIGGFVEAGIQKIRELKDRISKIFDSDAFRNADSLADKFFIIWDQVIAKPFSDWWNDRGRTFVTDIISKIGQTFGEALHGIGAGIMAALRGEEIDAEGLNLTGIAAAGAETAKAYVSSFVEGLNAGDLFGRLPGLLKGGLVAFGALKVGGGVLSAAKSLGMLKIALSSLGVGSTTAAAALSGVSGAASAAGASAAAAAGSGGVGGLGAALAAIPGWGWAALAALTAVGIGMKLYHDHQERERYAILHAGDAVEEAAERYQAAAQRASDVHITIDALENLTIQPALKDVPEDEIEAVKAALKDLGVKEVGLYATLYDQGWNTEEAQGILDQLQEASSKRAWLWAWLMDNGYDTTEAGDILKQIDEATSEVAELEAMLEHGDYDEEKAKEIQGQIDAAKSKVAMLSAWLIDLGYDKDEVDLITGQFQELNTKTATLKYQAEDLGFEGVDDVIKAFDALETEKTATLKATLDAAGYSPIQAGIIIAEYNSVTAGQKEIRLILSSSTDMTSDEIGTLVSNLTALQELKTGAEIKITGYQMSDGDVDDLKAKAESIKSTLAGLEIKIAEAQTKGDVKGAADLMQQYTSLKQELAVIDIQIQGSKMSKAEYDALVERHTQLEGEMTNIMFSIMNSEGSDLTAKDVEHIWDLLAQSADAQWKLGVTLKTGSVTKEDLEAYNQQLESYAQHIEELSGGLVTAESLLSGEHAEENQKMLSQAEQLAAENSYLDLLLASKEAEETRGARLERRTAAEETLGKYENTVSEMSELLPQMLVLKGAVENYQKQVELGKMTEEAAAASFGGEYGELMTEVANRYNLLGLSHEDMNTWESWVANSGDAASLPEDYFGMWLENIAESKLPEYNELVANARVEYDDANAQLVKEYQGNAALSTAGVLLGTDYQGETLETMAAGYAELSDEGRALFEKAALALAEVNANADYITDGEKLSTSDLTAAAVASAEAQGKNTLLDRMKEQMQAMETLYTSSTSAEAQSYAMNNINGMLGSIGLGSIDSIDQLSAKMEQMAGLDLSGINFDSMATSLIKAGGQASDAKAKVDAVRTAMEQLDGQIANVSINVTQSGSPSAAGVSAPGSAEGGIYDGAFLSWVAEDGPEAIIPLGAKRRERGLDLWLAAGRALGVNEFAEGGILAPYAGMLAAMPDSAWNDEGGGSGDYRPGLGGSPISVTVEVNPEYTIEGASDPGAVLDALRAHQNELAEMVGGALAEIMADAHSNM